MKKVHDMTDLDHGTPFWFILSARLLPLGIVSQFLSAGVLFIPRLKEVNALIRVSIG
jgi:hypothetical protein